MIFSPRKGVFSWLPLSFNIGYHPFPVNPGVALISAGI